jgi:hypothetical protein
MAKLETNSDRFPSANGDGKAAFAEAEACATRTVASGAIMILPGCPVMRFLVGDFVWLEAGRIFWFTAYGDSPGDGHLLEFDDVRMVDGVGVSFSRREKIVGQLTRIEQAGVDDPDDYRIAWQLWQEVAPLRAAMIESSGATLAGEAWRTRAGRWGAAIGFASPDGDGDRQF